MAETIADDTLSNSESIDSRVKALQLASDETEAKGLPATDLLWKFCDQDLIKRAAWRLGFGLAALAEGESRCRENPLFANMILSGLDAICDSNSLHIKVLSELRDAIIFVREGADKLADIEDILKQLIPENPEVSKLYLKILREQEPGVSEKAIALEFTKKDKQRADSLLRMLRRLRQRLREALP